MIPSHRKPRRVMQDAHLMQGAKMLHMHKTEGQKYNTEMNEPYCFQLCVCATLQHS